MLAPRHVGKLNVPVSMVGVGFLVTDYFTVGEMGWGSKFRSRIESDEK
jgi:hypothetical protein